MTAERALGFAAGVLAVLAAAAGSPNRAGHASIDVTQLSRMVAREDDHVTAIELAEWIRARHPRLRIVDVRSQSDFEAYHVPGAERIPIDALAEARLSRNETIVLYSDGGAHAAPGWVFLRALGYERVYFLRGGLYEWLDEVMNPTVAANAPDSARSRFARASALGRYFGGVPRIGSAVSSVVPLPGVRDSSRTATAVARVRRRGC